MSNVFMVKACIMAGGATKSFEIRLHGIIKHIKYM